MIRRSGERGSGISMPVARHDDDDDDVYNNMVAHNDSYLIYLIYDT